MKVVLFCGGLGTRLREHSDTIPKPLVNVGYPADHLAPDALLRALRPQGLRAVPGLSRRHDPRVLPELQRVHVQRLHAVRGGKQVDLLSSDIADWRITFVDTGMHANLGPAPAARAQHLAGRGDVPRQLFRRPARPRPAAYIAQFQRSGADRELRVGAAVAELPRGAHRRRRHRRGASSRSHSPTCGSTADSFACASEIFDAHRRKARNWSSSRSQRLIEQRKLWTHRHEGFWAAMDTFKDKITFDRMEANGRLSLEDVVAGAMSGAAARRRDGAPAIRWE